MSGKWRRRVGYAAAALVMLFLGAALVRGWSQVRAYDWDVHYGLLAASVGVLLVFLCTSCVGYVAIVEALSPAPRPSRPGMMRVWGISILGRYVPGSVLMVLGRVEMSRTLGVDRRVSAAALVYEQGLGLGVGALGALVFVAFYGSLGSSWALLVLCAPLVLLMLMHPRTFGPLSAWLLKKVGREPLARLLSLGAIARLLAWYILTGVLLSLGVWLAMRALGGPEVGTLMFVGGAFLFAFTISMVMVIFPSGLGIRDGAFALALAMHVPGSVAVALSVASRLMLTVVELLFIAGVVLWSRRR